MKCPVCGESSRVLPDGKYLDPFENLEYLKFDCTACGSGFSSPMRNPGAQWYQRYEDVFGYKGKKDLMLRYRVAALEGLRQTGKTQKLLDIGCGYGGFLLEAKKLGFEVYGVDFDSRRTAAARAAGLGNVESCSIDAFCSANKAGGTKFDVITFFQFLEHVEAPGAFLEMVGGMLSPGGVLLLDVPNARRCLRGASGVVDEPPHHLTRWSSGGLAKFLRGGGFAEVTVKDDVYPLLDFYANLFFAITGALLASVRRGPRAAGTAGAAPSGGADSPRAGRLARLKAAVVNAVLAAYMLAAVPLTILMVYPLVKFMRSRGRGLFILSTAKKTAY